MVFCASLYKSLFKLLFFYIVFNFLFIMPSQIYTDGISPDSNYTLYIKYQEIGDTDDCDPNL